MDEFHATSFVAKYRGAIILHGVEILWPRAMAAAFAHDLETAVWLVVGCDGWRYVELSDGNIGIVQDLGVDLAVEEYIPYLEMTVTTNSSVIQAFLANLPERIDLVSFQLDDPELTSALIDALEAEHKCG